jgi:hypothetical protein
MQVQGNRPQGAARRAVPVDGWLTAILEFLQLPAPKAGNCDVESLVEAKPGPRCNAVFVRMCPPQAEEPAFVSSKREPDFRGSPCQLHTGCAQLNADSARGYSSFRLSMRLPD